MSGPSVTPTEPPLSAGAPHETELTPGWDESPDGPAPTPDADLSDADLKALLRTRAEAAAGDSKCGPEDVDARLSGLDAAAGHRYTSLVVKNTSKRACVVEGVAGVGARGQWGHRFTLIAEPGIGSGFTGPVRLSPGDAARSLLEWTGNLPGNGAERASILVFQLAAGQVPVPVPTRISNMPGEEDALDVGMDTTIRLAPFEPVA